MRKIGVAHGLLLLLLLVSPATAGTDSGSRLFPLPMIEAERTISRWFTDSGFQTAVADAGLGERQVLAQKAGEEWRIVLKPSSPLNTEISVRSSGVGTNDAARLDALWALIERSTRNVRPPMAAARPASAERNGTAPMAVDQHRQAIVCLENAPGAGHIQLSGFAYDESGMILTTAHDVQERAALTVTTSDGQRLEGRAVKIDHLRDLALVQAAFHPQHAISPTKGRLALTRGETIYTIGCPQGTFGTVYVGTVNSPPRLANAMPLWQVGMTVLPGGSGSPVFDVQGNLAGVIKGRFRGTDSVGFLIPVSIVLEFLGR